MSQFLRNTMNSCVSLMERALSSASDPQGARNQIIESL